MVLEPIHARICSQAVSLVLVAPHTLLFDRSSKRCRSRYGTRRRVGVEDGCPGVPGGMTRYLSRSLPYVDKQRCRTCVFYDERVVAARIEAVRRRLCDADIDITYVWL